MRDDILLTADGDLYIGETGDIELTTSIRQAVLIRLRWFFEEWRFAPEFGVPYLEEIFVKNPNDTRIRQIIREECMTVDGVTDVQNITLTISSATREATIKFKIAASEQLYAEEIKIKI